MTGGSETQTGETRPPESARQDGDKSGERKTTRGMLPELKAVDAIYRELSALNPPERAWAIDFLYMKFPKP